MRILTLLFFFFNLSFCKCQDSTLHESKTILPRVGISFQKNFLYEVGIDYNYNFVSFTLDTNFIEDGTRKTDSIVYPLLIIGSLSYYCSYEAPLKQNINLHLFKIGCDLSNYRPSQHAFGIELNYIKNKDDYTFGVTPKFGMEFLVFNFYYGYRIYGKNTFKDYLKSHQFSITFKLAPKYWKNKIVASQKKNEIFRLLRAESQIKENQRD
ncbi:MAG: hypothetical protein CMP67_01355 [Flavobacteriales bacterium]|nr:hypothetical protein [Flavobacteriales bacterium]|tara:strand:- start:4669 stop:5298 length:630 start_codon:yes stop_codon:yes gene_type:complete